MSLEEILEIVKIIIVFVAAMMASYAISYLIRKFFNKNK